MKKKIESIKVDDLVSIKVWDCGRGNSSFETFVGRVLMIEDTQVVVRLDTGLKIFSISECNPLSI